MELSIAEVVEVGSWNYRMIRIKDSAEGDLVAMYEVWYNADGSIRGWHETPKTVIAPTADDIQKTLFRMMRATRWPICQIIDIDGTNYLVEEDGDGVPNVNKPAQNRRLPDDMRDDANEVVEMLRRYWREADMTFQAETDKL